MKRQQLSTQDKLLPSLGVLAFRRVAAPTLSDHRWVRNAAAPEPMLLCSPISRVYLFIYFSQTAFREALKVHLWVFTPPTPPPLKPEPITSGGCIKSEIFPLQWKSGNCLPRRNRCRWKDGQRWGGWKLQRWNELKETWETEREGRCLEDGWIGAEHQKDGRIKEARVRGVGKEIAELSV